MKIVPVSEIPGKSVVQDCPTTTRRLSSMSVYKTCLEMKEVCELEKGIGLSAVQVGLPWRLFIVKEEDGNIVFLSIVSTSQFQLIRLGFGITRGACEVALLN